MYISLYDLGLFILFTIIVVGSAYLIAVLHRVFGILAYVRDILRVHNTDISETLAELPKTLVNVGDLAVSLKRTVDQTGNVIGGLQADVTDTVDELRDDLETFVLYARVVGEFLQALFSKIKS